MAGHGRDQDFARNGQAVQTFLENAFKKLEDRQWQQAGYDITDGGRLISFDNGVDLPEVYGYDAAGVVNCTVSGMGTKTCTPLWSAVSGYNGSGFPASPAVVDGTLFINIPGAGAIYAYTGLPMLP